MTEDRWEKASSSWFIIEYDYSNLNSPSGILIVYCDVHTPVQVNHINGKDSLMRSFLKLILSKYLPAQLNNHAIHRSSYKRAVPVWQSSHWLGKQMQISIAFCLFLSWRKGGHPSITTVSRLLTHKLLSKPYSKRFILKISSPFHPFSPPQQVIPLALSFPS